MVFQKKKKPPLNPNDAFGPKGGAHTVDVSIPQPAVNVLVAQANPKEMSEKYLRYAAGVYYATDLNGCSVEDLTKHPIYGVIPGWKLTDWSREDKWHSRREANKEQWRKKIEAAVGSKLAQARVSQLEGLQRIYDKALAKLEGEAVEAGSWEGVAGVLLRLAELMDEWRGRMAAEIWPAMMEANESGALVAAQAVRPKLSRDEARSAALLIIQKRRDEMAAKNKADGEPKP